MEKMLSINTNTNKAFTIRKFHKTKPNFGRIKTVDLKYDSIGEVCGGEILFVLDEGKDNEGKQNI